MADRYITRWDPFRDLMSIQSELNRLFGRTYGGQSDAGTAVGSGSAWVPALDAYETPDKIVVTLELPGIEPDDVDVTVEDSTLTVSGTREFYNEVSEDNFHRVERRFGSFSRTITLPSTANAEAIDARFDKGVLTIEIPKVEEAKPKKISIKATA
jgi:HSP20 family protein